MKSPGPVRLVISRDGVIGRDRSVEYPVDHASVTRRHCELRLQNAVVQVRDMGSRNGTWLNGERIEQAVLADRDILQVGTLRLRVESTADGLSLIAAGDAEVPRGVVLAGRDPTETAGQASRSSRLLNRDEPPFAAALDAVRTRLASDALLLFELSPAGSIQIGESANGSYPMSASVLDLVMRKSRAIWAPRDIPAGAVSLQGCSATSVFCAPICKRDDRVIAVYAFWSAGCQNTDAVERTAAGLGELMGLWAFERTQPSATAEARASSPAPEFAFRLVGRSPAYLRMIQQLQRVALTDHPVILIGLPGSGKTTIAQMTHQASRRCERAFRRLHCAKIPSTLVESELLGTRRGAFSGAIDHEGLLLATDGGTLFLDSLESCPLEVQAKLLDVLEGRAFRPLGSTRERTVDLRWIAATNEDPQALIRQGRLRRDLWDRLAAQVIRIPALSERVTDIPSLAMHFLERELQENATIPAVRGFSPQSIRLLQKHSWPGNVRELSNVVSRLVTSSTTEIISEADVARILGDEQTIERLPEYASLLDLPYKQAVKAFQDMYVRMKLVETAQNRSDAASKSGISRKGLYKILKRSKQETSG